MKYRYKIQLVCALIAAIGFGGRLWAQQIEIDPNPNASKVRLAPIERAGVVDMRAPSENWDVVFKMVQKMPIPGIDARKDRVRELKAEANRLHDKLIAEEEANGVQSTAKTTNAWPPTLGTNFFGNSYGGGDPADNALAISAGGLMISGNNTRFHTYDANGTQTSSKNFTQFAAAAGVSVGFTFDPKCTYDPVEDKFVVAFLNGGSSSNSQVIVGFSQTNDPAGAWNVYAINGNVNGLGVWTDFVQIGLNANELFVTGNPFTNAGSSQGVAIWQIPKAAGFAGTALNPTLHYMTGAFSLNPVQGGATLYGPNMFFLESELGNGSTVNLHQITNSAANNGVLNSAVTFNLGISYGVPPDADQKGTTINLKTNDTRVQSSYYENSRIEFVFNTASNSRAGIFHGTGQISPFALSFSAFSGQQLSIPGLDIAYPSITYAGQQDVSGFNQSYIGFNTSGAANFPGCAAVFADDQGYSPHVVIREGSSFINSADQRWGDYSGIHPRAGHPGEAWYAGTIGNSSNQQRTYIGQLLPPQPVANTPSIATAASLQIAPNPTTEEVRFIFPVDEAGMYRVLIRDLQGRTVKTVVQDWLVVGTAQLRFNAAYLPAATYLVSVENDTKQLYTEKLVVTH